ncbi:MAG: hypothetical protein KF703_05380 [Actinobacteria bacterium]|nr:hypothetical protein [Actinomycetota bacterium]
MRAHVLVTRAVRFAAVVALACSPLAACTDDGADDATSGGSGHAAALRRIAAVLPADTRGVFTLDLAALRSGPSAVTVADLLAGDGGEPLFAEQFETVGDLAAAVGEPDRITSAALVHTTDATDGVLLVAEVGAAGLDEVVAPSDRKAAGTHGPKDRPLYRDSGGHHLALLPGGLLVVGEPAAVESVVDVADGAEPEGESAIEPFLAALDADADLSFVYGLRALFDGDVEPDRTLRGAAVASGSLEAADGDPGGSLAFHTSNASEFVEAYNALNRHATAGEDATEEPLTIADPVAQELGQVVVPLPPTPLDASSDDTVVVRNIAKKLFVGMEAHDYTEDVSSTGNAPLIDLIIRSEADQDTPPSPGAVFFRWEFRDQAAMEAFTQNELPPGFQLAPTQFLESDDPDGEYFLALMLYNAGGGSIVEGARAEWDVFVSPPKGADPDAPNRPRYLIIQNLSEEVSGDPTTLLTTANPVSYEFDGDRVVSDVRKLEGGVEVPVFSSSFPKPDPATAEVTRWTPEMAIANDYMHWPNGVYDHIVYNATTYNWDGYFVDAAQTTIVDNTRWTQYLKPTLKDATYYVNTLEYVASPLANLDSPFLEVTPQEREDLKAFKDNGHQRGIMRQEVEDLFMGTDDAYVGFRVANGSTPSTSYSFEVTDPEGLAEAVDLPEGTTLAPTTILEGGEERYYLTLSVYEVEDAIEGTRAEWSTYVDDGSGRPHQQVLDLMTAEVGIDPVGILNLPSEVRHGLDDGVVHTRLWSPSISFEASFETAGTADTDVTLDWVESGDDVCYANGVCDRLYYDAGTLDTPVHRPAKVTVDRFSTPWTSFVASAPSIVFYRDNEQQYAAKRWHNLEVEVEAEEVSGDLEGRTHTIEGRGTLVGRTSQVADSDYAYTGEARVEGDELTFTIDQRVDNALGTSHIYTRGTFDLTTGEGTQTVVDCRGPALMCSDIEAGSEAPYTAQDLDSSDPDAITWKVDVAVDLGSSFGTADSASTFTATRGG